MKKFQLIQLTLYFNDAYILISIIFLFFLLTPPTNKQLTHQLVLKQNIRKREANVYGNQLKKHKLTASLIDLLNDKNIIDILDK